MKGTAFTGTMLSEAPFANIAVLFAQSGLDFFIIDTEHGCFDSAVLSGLIMNANLSGIQVIIRIADNSRRDITRLMDLGAGGLLLPMTNSAGDIERVVEYAMYAPLGRRGISTTRAHTRYNPPALEQYMADANRRTKIFAQIETSAGLNALEDIVAVEGVTGVMVGPNDLAVDLQCIGNDEPVMAAMDRVSYVCSALGKQSGIITANTQLLERASQTGYRWFSIGSELNMLKSGCQTIMNMAQALPNR